MIGSVEDIQAKIDAVRRLSWDAERAHAEEDKLYRMVLQEIATGRLSKEDAEAWAKAALQTLGIDFPRWRT